MKKSIILILSIFLLFSCSSFQDLVNQDMGGLPSWISNPPIRRDRVGFVSSGTGYTEAEARNDAYKNCLYTVSSDLGLDVYTLYYRELSTTGNIKSLDARTDRTYFNPVVSGKSTCYILVTFDQELYEQTRTEEFSLQKERREKIAQKLEEANKAYRENRDFDAYTAMLEAILISFEGDNGNPEYSSSRLLDEAIYYLSPLEINVTRNRNDASATIRVTRNRGILSPAVVGAPIKGEYVMRNTLGEMSRNSVEAVTDKKGRYYFNSTNPYILRTGQITFSLFDANDYLGQIDRVAPLGFTKELHSLLEEKSVSYSYDIQDKERELDLDVLIVEYDERGMERGTSDALSSFNTYMQECQVSLSASEGVGEEEEDVYNAYLSSGKVNKLLAIIRIGISESIYTDSKYIVKVESYLTIYDNETGQMIYSDDSVDAIGYGGDKKSAERDAFSQAGRIIASLLLIDFRR